jgi:hypothetical protein
VLACGIGVLTESDTGFDTGNPAVLLIRVEHEQRANQEYGQENPVFELHFYITPPFTSPSGPVQWRVANSHPSIAVIPITVNVIANAKTSG